MLPDQILEDPESVFTDPAAAALLSPADLAAVRRHVEACRAEADWFEAVWVGGKLHWRVADAQPSPVEPPRRPLGGRQEPSRETPVEAETRDDGQVVWGPTEPRTPTEAAKRKWLVKWLELGDEDREPLLARADRNMGEEFRKTYREYAAYCLYVRARHTPLSRAEFRGGVTSLKATVRKARSRRRPSGGRAEAP